MGGLKGSIPHINFKEINNMEKLKVLFKNNSRLDLNVPNTFGISEDVSTFRLKCDEEKQVIVNEDSPIAIYEEICWIKKTDRNDRFYSGIKLKKRRGFNQILKEPVIFIDLNF